MSSFLDKVTTNSQTQLALTALISGVTVAAAIFGYQALDREQRLSRLKGSIPDLTEDLSSSQVLSTWGGPLTTADKEDLRNAALARRAQAGDFDEELIHEQLARNRVFLTPEGLDKLRSAFAIVVGLGGVGSHCVTALARSGVSRLRLIDFDQVTLSSLNRHAVATLADVGMPKVQCLHRRLIAITPWVKWDLRQEKFDEHVASVMLGPWLDDGQKPDYVVDAIDNIDTKVHLLKYCHDHNIPVISAMGAGCKSDPTRIIVGDISATTDDPLSRATRRRLKLQGITSGIPTIFSTEKTGDGKAELLPLPEEEFKKGAVGDLGVLPSFRVRILPVLGTMPAVFGYTAANHVILSLTGYPMTYLPAKSRSKMYDGILGQLQAAEERLLRRMTDGSHDAAAGLKIPVAVGDVAFLVDDLWGARSGISGIPSKLVLARWKPPSTSILVTIGEGKNLQKSSNVRLRDLVCFTKEEAANHENKIFNQGRKLEDVYDSATIAKVEARLQEAAAYEDYR